MEELKTNAKIYNNKIQSATDQIRNYKSITNHLKMKQAELSKFKYLFNEGTLPSGNF